ncbi:MAG TPA: FAD-binding oxidoreductase [Steroidobacteraceae bacterium]|nr:FAD-binding oxidoreductase [Steroidobacteraceae bacterium]
MTSRAILASELRALLGERSVLTDEADMQFALVDHRRLYRGRALAVAQPDSVEEVSRLIGWCNERRIGVVPQGGNTSYCGGATPDESGDQLVLSLRRLNRIRSVDPQNFSIVAEAGCVLATLQQAAEAAERFFPLSLGSEGSCQIGGNLSTNAGGLNVVRYGMTRQLVLGLEAVLPDGSLLSNLKSLRKDNTGYNLGSLLVGAEGTLGVITAASLRLWPRIRSSATAFLALSRPADAIAVLTRLLASAGEYLSSFELIPRIGVELTGRFIEGVTDPFTDSYPWYALCELTASAEAPLQELLQQTLAAASEQGELRDAAFATSERARQSFWRLRENIPEAQRHFGPSLKHDISVPVSALPAFIAEASAWVQDNVPDGVLVSYGHAGDGNLHFNVNRAEGADTAAFMAREPVIKRAIHDLVARYQGSFSAEHGIGRLKREELQRYAPPAALQMMRVIKRAIDPNGIMNPGKLL